MVMMQSTYVKKDSTGYPMAESFQKLIRRLSIALQDTAESLENGAVVVIEESRHRVRFLPPGTKQE